MSQELINLIKNRRSIFPASYTREEISKETLLEVIEAANTAPTHKLTQPWRFTIFRGNGLVKLADKFAELYQEGTPAPLFMQKKLDATREKVLQSSAVIAINLHVSGALPEWEELAATACAVENLWLAASALGIGGYWSSPGTISQLSDFLNLAPNEKCIGLFYMGYHQEEPKAANRKSVETVVRWEE
ncbi:Nitroreductase [bacterium A37T11]|nr:Nitroreductase [bacterium A37T11]